MPEHDEEQEEPRNQEVSFQVTSGIGAAPLRSGGFLFVVITAHPEGDERYG